MKKPILIAYATCTGSTVEVARTIGETLGKNGISVEVKPIEAELQIEDYQAVLIGSAVQYGDWLPEAVEFVKTNQRALNQLPLALFCVHIRNTANDPESRQNRLAYLDKVRPLVQPVSEGFFAGRFDRQGAALLLPKWAAPFVPPIDLRKWEKMRAWAETVQPLLI
jgi:menaquinone-dependent protoporphyrinogen oxidase